MGIDLSSNASISKSGHFEKESEMGIPFKGKRWSSRWAMLHRDGVLYYFESFKEVSENVARGVICLDGAELTKLDSFNGRDFCVRVVSPLGRHAHKAAPSVWLLSFASQ